MRPQLEPTRLVLVGTATLLAAAAIYASTSIYKRSLRSGGVYRWSNWEGRHSCCPDHYHLPSTIEEIKEIIQNANENKESVKVVGAGHSWSDIAVVDRRGTITHMLSLDNYAKVLEVDIVQKTIRVQAGMRLMHLHEVLSSYSLALPNLGSVSEQSVAGAFSTGTHGTGVKHKILASALLELDLVTATGEVITCSREQNEDIFHAASVGLGALGVIVSVKLQVVEAFDLRGEYIPSRLSDVLSRLPQLLSENEWVKMWWVPHTDFAKLFIQHRVQPPTGGKREQQQHQTIAWRSRLFIEEYLFTRFAFEPLLKMITWFPFLCRPLFNLIGPLICASNKPLEGRSDKIFNLYYVPLHAEAEFAVPIACLEPYLRDVEKGIQEENLLINFVTEIRFVASDDAWMSPAYGEAAGGGWSFVTFMTYSLMHDKNTQRYFQLAEELAITKYKGRPHWAKAHTVTSAYLRKSLPRFDDFCQLRKRLDPNGIFLNDYLRRTLLD